MTVFGGHGDTRRDCISRAFRPVWPAIEEHCAAGKRRHAEDRLEQPALAGAEHTGHRHHLTLMQ